MDPPGMKGLKVTMGRLGTEMYESAPTVLWIYLELSRIIPPEK
jgi:hypothetical protein